MLVESGSLEDRCSSRRFDENNPMIKVKTYCYSALGFLAVVYLSTFVSLAQNSPMRESSRPTAGDRGQITFDPFAVLPASDALIMLDLKRFSSDAVPRLLVGEPDARALVIALPDPKTIELLDPRSIQRLVVGLRYSKPQDAKSAGDFEVVTVAQSSEAGQLPTLIRSRGSGKYREQQYAGKLLYITHLEPSRYEFN